MSVEISDGSNFFSWYNAPSGDLELSFRTPNRPEAPILQATKEGRLVSAAYTNVGDPANLGYEMVVVDPSGALQRIKGHFASFQSLLAASGLGNTGIDLPAIQRNQTALAASIADLNRTLTDLSASSGRTAALVGGTDSVRLANSLALLTDRVNRLSSSSSVSTVSSSTLGLTIGGIAILALGAAVAFLYFRKR
jgi:hypothetical protein